MHGNTCLYICIYRYAYTHIHISSVHMIQTVKTLWNLYLTVNILKQTKENNENEYHNRHRPSVYRNPYNFPILNYVLIASSLTIVLASQSTYKFNHLVTALTSRHARIDRLLTHCRDTHKYNYNVFTNFQSRTSKAF